MKLSLEFGSLVSRLQLRLRMWIARLALRAGAAREPLTTTDALAIPDGAILDVRKEKGRCPSSWHVEILLLPETKHRATGGGDPVALATSERRSGE